MKRKRVRFVQPVDFYADTEKAMEEVIRDYMREPCFASDGAGQHGCYGWKQARPYRLKAKP